MRVAPHVAHGVALQPFKAAEAIQPASLSQCLAQQLALLLLMLKLTRRRADPGHHEAAALRGDADAQGRQHRCARGAPTAAVGCAVAGLAIWLLLLLLLLLPPPPLLEMLHTQSDTPAVAENTVN